MYYYNILLFNIYYILEKKYKIKQINQLIIVLNNSNI
jgi:hypothetical protein